MSLIRWIRFFAAVVAIGAMHRVTAVGTITFDNRTDHDITAHIEYNDMVKFLCESHSLEIKAHKKEPLKREWSGLKGYCPIGEIVFSFGDDNVPAARMGSSALPLFNQRLHVILSMQNGALQVSKEKK